jgi:hypothetical protein
MRDYLLSRSLRSFSSLILTGKNQAGQTCGTSVEIIKIKRILRPMGSKSKEYVMAVNANNW